MYFFSETYETKLHFLRKIIWKLLSGYNCLELAIDVIIFFRIYHNIMVIVLKLSTCILLHWWDGSHGHDIQI